MLERARKNPKIEWLLNKSVEEILAGPNGKVRGVRLADTRQRRGLRGRHRRRLHRHRPPAELGDLQGPDRDRRGRLRQGQERHLHLGRGRLRRRRHRRQGLPPGGHRRRHGLHGGDRRRALARGPGGPLSGRGGAPHRRHRGRHGHRPRDRPAPGGEGHRADAPGPRPGAARGDRRRARRAAERASLARACDVRDRSAVDRAFSPRARDVRPAPRAGGQRRRRRPQRGRPARPLGRDRAHQPRRRLLLPARGRAPPARRPGRGLPPGGDLLDPRAHRRRGLHGLLRLEGRAARVWCARSPWSSPRAACRSTPSVRAGSRPRWPAQGLEGMARGLGVSLDEARALALGARCRSAAWPRPRTWPASSLGCVSADARGVTGQGLDINGGAFMI